MAAPLIDTAVARKIVPVLDTSCAVLQVPNLYQRLCALSGGNIPGPIDIPEDSPLVQLVNLLAPVLLATPEARLEINKEPCALCSKKHKRCIVVSGVNEPKLCERCKGRGLAQCAPKNTAIERQQTPVTAPPAVHPGIQNVVSGYQALRQLDFIASSSQGIPAVNYANDNYAYPFEYPNGPL